MAQPPRKALKAALEASGLRFLKLPRHCGWSLNQRHDFMVFLLSFVLACVSPKWTARVGQLIEPFENHLFGGKENCGGVGLSGSFLRAPRLPLFPRQDKKNRPRRGGVAAHRLRASRGRFFFFKSETRPDARRRPSDRRGDPTQSVAGAKTPCVARRLGGGLALPRLQHFGNLSQG